MYRSIFSVKCANAPHSLVGDHFFTAIWLAEIPGANSARHGAEIKVLLPDKQLNIPASKCVASGEWCAWTCAGPDARIECSDSAKAEKLE
jgi:hypothetical protein